MSTFFDREILPLFEEYRGDILETMRAKAIEIAMRDPERICTSDMVRAECPLPPGVNPNVMGSLFKGQDNRWKRIGSIPSVRKQAHGRWIGVYRLLAVTAKERTETLLMESVGK